MALVRTQVPLKTCRVEGLMDVKSVEVESPTLGVVWANVKTAVVTLGTGDLPSLLPSLKCTAHKKITINARREFSGRLCGHTAKEVCGSSVMPVESGFYDASKMSWLLVGPAIPHLPRDLLNCKIKTLSPRETTLVMKPKHLTALKGYDVVREERCQLIMLQFRTATFALTSEANRRLIRLFFRSPNM
ncbi:hypothetical protein TNCV_1556841 [Trichonephila clavipes]|nr:hypothetical protein TNCV_1556841 [Trichonephila clavipes]